MMLGTQVLRGFAADSWTQYLDAAGYPRESRLPSTYQYRPAAPIAQRRDAAAVAPAPPPVNTTAPAPSPAPARSGPIRF